MGSSGGLYTLHDVWERAPANNLPQTPHSAGAYDTGYVLLIWHLNLNSLLYVCIFVFGYLLYTYVIPVV
jgi:hypothetical protein